MNVRKLTNWMPLLSLTVPAAVYFSLQTSGVLSFFAILYSFVLIPLIELMTPPINYNLDESQKTRLQTNPWFDFLLYLTVPFQFSLLVLFLFVIKDTPVGTIEWFGKIFSMGASCGVLGINAAHELGHRTKWHEKLMAKSLLMTSLYMHFFIEHNKGHHRHVSTPRDPASARSGEALYPFIVRSVIGSIRSAWKLDRKEFCIFFAVEVLLLVGIALVFGAPTLLAFVMAAGFGIFLLESVNYIEHYGLVRKLNPSGRYEKVTPIHSWNSDHILGRGMLFNLSRHSDHHANANKKYQYLDSYPDSPQMPTGYPGMILLALVPPLWFRIMDAKVAKLA